MEPRMRFDDVAWEESENIESAWVKAILKEPPYVQSATSSSNTVVASRQRSMIRFPKPGCTMFPEEKIRNEVATIRYIQDNTSIPVPFVLHWGTREESPLRLGPFILMEYINHETDVGKVLNMPELHWQDRPLLNPHIDSEKLEMLYSQIAHVLLQLSKLEFPTIGSLRETDEFTWEAQLPNRTFSSSSDYFEALAQLHVDHLRHQRNDAVDSETDCKRKYVARHLFYKLARQRRLTYNAHDNGPFKLWCDDLRPSNILLDDNMRIVGVVDWEFTYAAPIEFSFAPPWWLLLEQPEYWPGGAQDWIEVYETRLKTFLKAMTDTENKAIASGRLMESQRLAPKMKMSWESGDFWVTYGARKNFAFDAIFWRELDPRIYGQSGVSEEDAWMKRLDIFEMKALVERKTKDMDTRGLGVGSRGAMTRR
ncbi:hypothetical protein ED733_006619 [Metarhizium rileyi]|uniref:Aminoglycoside phosphotransferase domain-containing protein n=1 Tax=Metarhizium rileyi (strain RCEF 4871) TaxID=1649241 RepID=A0A5C6GFQ0_METRR|nr:hypothetical protein ED733_006619 [Metarhizium rileyi]